jgi:hypothetical protein
VLRGSNPTVVLAPKSPIQEGQACSAVTRGSSSIPSKESPSLVGGGFASLARFRSVLDGARHGAEFGPLPLSRSNYLSITPNRQKRTTHAQQWMGQAGGGSEGAVRAGPPAKAPRWSKGQDDHPLPV